MRYRADVLGTGVFTCLILFVFWRLWTTVLEISGRWPWQRPQSAAAK